VVILIKIPIIIIIRLIMLKLIAKAATLTISYIILLITDFGL
jgi:uncharacterized membrane protein (DUF441 family)